jgi:DNA-binding LacI/PurR family transcriptional regulator
MAHNTGVMAATLAEIARRTGLCKASVSQCLRPDGPRIHLFRPETRELVRRVAEELGYRPNTAARATSYGRTGSVALVMSIKPLHSSLFVGLLCGIHDELQRRDQQLTMARLPDEDLNDSSRLPKIVREWCCDGMMINYTDAIPTAMRTVIAKNRIPAVWINSKQTKDCVRPDDEAAAAMLTRKLLELGHRRIAFVDFSHGELYPEPHYSVNDRRLAYLTAMREAGVTPVIWRADGQTKLPGEERVAFAARRLRQDDRPTAIIGYSLNDMFPLHVAAAEVGLAIPRDLSIATFSATPYRNLNRPLSMMVLPEYRMGEAAVQMLMSKIEAPKSALKAQILPFDFDAGDSIAPVSS